MNLQKQELKTNRLNTAYYRAGEGNSKKLLLIHGNLSSSEFYLPLMEDLSKDLDVIALDLRCFGDSDALPVDATRGYRDWCEDIKEFVDAIGWHSFILTGWSLSGCNVMQFAIDDPQLLEGLVLINPGSPYGFGGTKDIKGTMLEPADLGAGAAAANMAMIDVIEQKSRDLPALTLSLIYFKPDFPLEDKWKEIFIDSILKAKTGEGMWPGDRKTCDVWPYVKAGKSGICNTMVPSYGNVSAIKDINPYVPILWIRIDSDVMVSDASATDLGTLGMAGKIPGWPGMDVFPPKPMVSQTRDVLEQYRENGGNYTETVLPGGHGCHLESPEAFINAVKQLAGI